MIQALLHFNFIQNAVLSAVLASIACGIVGTIIIEKKLVMMSGGIAHTSFGGVGLGYYLNIEPIIGALVFAVGAALGIATIKRRNHTQSDALIGMFWAVGMASGLLFIALTPGYPPDMTTYLFGDILTVSYTDLYIMITLDAIIVLVLIVLFNYLKSYLFDQTFTAVRGIKTVFLEYMLFILISLTIVVLIRVVGIILIIALLSVPPAIIKQFTYSLKKIMLFSILLGVIFCLSGLWISYELNIASGASIILFSVVTYMIVSVIKTCLKKSSKQTIMF